MLYSKDEFCLNVPFTFPEFVNPVGTKMSKKEKIEITVNAIDGSELVSPKMSHSMKVHIWFNSWWYYSSYFMYNQLTM